MILDSLSWSQTKPLRDRDVVVSRRLKNLQVNQIGVASVFNIVRISVLYVAGVTSLEVERAAHLRCKVCGQAALALDLDARSTAVSYVSF